MTSSYHERHEDLSERSRDMHRALSSLMEELEAVDWYQQRVDATSDSALKEILAHNRDEEIEHAAMVIEWLRRNNAKFDEQLRRFLFTDGPIAGQEEGDGEDAAAGSLRLGKLRHSVDAGRGASTNSDKDSDDGPSA